VAIIHAVNTSWAKLLLFNPDELLGQLIRRIVEDASLRDSRNRINHFHAQQAEQILLKAAIASGTVDSYVEKFLFEDGINFKWLPAERLNKLKRYLEMFSEL